MHPFLLKFGKNYNVIIIISSPRQQHAHPQTRLQSCSQILVHLKTYKIVINTANIWARLPDKRGRKVFWRPLVESFRYSAFYLLCVRIFRLYGTYLFGFKGQSFIPAAHGNQLPLCESKFSISLTHLIKFIPSTCSSISTKSKQMFL